MRRGSGGLDEVGLEAASEGSLGVDLLWPIWKLYYEVLFAAVVLERCAFVAGDIDHLIDDFWSQVALFIDADARLCAI